MNHLTTSARLVSLVVPVYNEAENVLPLLDAISSLVRSEHETIFVYDSDDDTTLPSARSYAKNYPQLRLLKNERGRGVLNALVSGLAAARGDVVVVTMADLSDEISLVDEMAHRARSGADVVAASRYMNGGQQVGGPILKSTLSRVAGLTLHWLTGIGTHDATSNFKAYSRGLLDSVTIESRSGFELALELTTKAHLGGFSIDEIPTTWKDRMAGESHFKLARWLPGYLRWYIGCIIRSWLGARRHSIACNANSLTSVSAQGRSSDG